MKRILLLILIITPTVYGQTFTNALAAKTHSYAFAANPVLINFNDRDESGLFLQGGYTLPQNYYLNAQLGLGLNENYFGVYVKKSLHNRLPFVSTIIGLHLFNDFAIDFAGLVTIPMSRKFNATLGIDNDYVFAEKSRFNPATDKIDKETELEFWSWLLLEGEYMVYKRYYLSGTVQFGLTEKAYNLFSVGLKYKMR